MAEASQRQLPGRQPGAEGRIEELLLAGLDHYLAGHYEQAINVWTRVLFLDGGQTRARAYLDRARLAQAEQLRESEELLQSGTAAFERGEVELARRLATSSMAGGGAEDAGLQLLARVSRLEAALKAADAAAATTDGRAGTSRDGERIRAGRMRGWFGPALAAGLGVVAGLVLVAVGTVDGRWSVTGPSRVTVSRPRGESQLPLGRSSERALEEARQFQEAGNLEAAVARLRQIREEDPLRPAADDLLAGLQAAALAGAEAGDGAAAQPVP